MKRFLKAVCALSATFPLAGLASVLDNTNQIAIAILSYAAMDNEDDLDTGAEYPVRYTDWNGMLDAVALPGLTRQDKDTALTDYLMLQSTNNLAMVDGEECELIRVAMCECRDLNHTNALPIVRNFFLNPTALYMGEPVYLYYKWAPVDEDFMFVTRSFLANTSPMARKSKPADLLNLDDALNRHKKTYGNDTAYTNAMSLVYQFRGFCPESAVVLDRMYISHIADYEQSSNRLATVMAWLASTNCTSEVRAHCVAVTNHLMNAGRPLPEVESLRGL